MKKFEFHFDALIVAIAVFALAVGFIFYQRHQFSDVMQKNIDLTWENENLKVDLILRDKQFDRCKNELQSARKWWELH